MSGWLDLTQLGLAPNQKHQAFLAHRRLSSVGRHDFSVVLRIDGAKLHRQANQTDTVTTEWLFRAASMFFTMVGQLHYGVLYTMTTLSIMKSSMSEPSPPFPLRDSTCNTLLVAFSL